MKKKVFLPKDELPHDGQAIEWWYFNGFLEGKKKYSFMTCLFKADTKKINMPMPVADLKNLYFSHTILYDLSSGKVERDLLPFVIISPDSFKRDELFVNYFYPLRKQYHTYEIARRGKQLHLKTGLFDLSAVPQPRVMYEGGNGFVDLGVKSTYYYSYPRFAIEGSIGEEKVKGIAWHDHQWATKGFMDDAWNWFSLQLPDKTDIMCVDYKGSLIASILYPNGKQEEVIPQIKPLAEIWKSKKTGATYPLRWELQIGKYTIHTSPIIKDCEMNFGTMHYWEGPITFKVNGKTGKGFMEIVPSQQVVQKQSLLAKAERKFLTKLFS